jgi:hypothetical protein
LDGLSSTGLLPILAMPTAHEAGLSAFLKAQPLCGAENLSREAKVQAAPVEKGGCGALGPCFARPASRKPLRCSRRHD